MKLHFDVKFNYNFNLLPFSEIEFLNLGSRKGTRSNVVVLVEIVIGTTGCKVKKQKPKKNNFLFSCNLTHRVNILE